MDEGSRRAMFHGDVSLGAMMNQGSISTGSHSHVGNLNYFSKPQRKTLETCRAQLLQALGEDPRYHRAALETRKGPRVRGTCDWILKQKEYLTWRSEPGQLLWISGGPGKGKTMLALYLITYREGITSAEPNTQKTIYFFCTAESGRNSGIAILRGLIYQLLQEEAMYKHVVDKYSTYGAMLFDDKHFEALWSVFESMTHQPGIESITCILDGLDECGKYSLSDFWVKIRGLFDPATQDTRDGSPVLRMIITNRNYPDSLEQELEGFARLRLEPDLRFELKRDVERFIEDRMNGQPCSERRRPDLIELRNVVKQKLSERANGTYLWVDFAIKALREERCVDLEDALDDFPSGLHAVYHRMIENVKKEKQDIVISILRWITFATRRLTLTELGVAVRMKPARGQDFGAAMEDYLAYAGDLIMIDTPQYGDESWKKQKIVLPVHSSLTDFLSTSDDHDPVLHKFHLNPQLSHGLLAARALDYALDVLTVTATLPQKDLQRFYKKYALYQYALEAGLQHFLGSHGVNERLRCDHALFNKSTTIHSQWLMDQSSEVAGLECTEGMTIVHLAALLGYDRILRSCVGSGTGKEGAAYTVDERDAHGRTPFFYATFNNKAEAALYLLEQGADVSTTDVLGQSPLHVACALGHEFFVRMLLKTPRVDAGRNSSSLNVKVRSMIDPTIDDEDETSSNSEPSYNGSGTPLHLAVWNNQLVCMKMLLSEDIDINARDDRKQTALHRAVLVEYNSVESCKPLLKKGFDKFAYDKEGRTAFHCACVHYKDTDVLQLLINNGMPVDTLTRGGDQIPSGMSALSVACKHGQIEAVNLLLDYKADVSRKDDCGRNALHWLCTVDPLCVDLAADQIDTAYESLFEKMSVDDIFARDAAGQTPYDLAVITFSDFVSRRKRLREEHQNVESLQKVFEETIKLSRFRAYLPRLDMWEKFIRIPQFSELESEPDLTETAFVEHMKTIAGVGDHLPEKRRVWNKKQYPTADDIPDDDARKDAFDQFISAVEKASIYNDILTKVLNATVHLDMYEADLFGSWNDFVAEWRGKGVITTTGLYNQF
ncbi:ankyrin [Lophiostoma macrostomum CBS 122681]|uniref:Ankyrin n=1 Tax=Lophiostoma macrostomum CBS 122681 TaxID=1314788 RepID=A0A6A6T683_9PLEO|nr:ankyrin [Lophiostoma macrostomum CBS 122681]